MENTVEKSAYNGWLVSNNIVKRSFAVLGHQILAQLLIILAILVIAIPITLILNLSS